MRLDIVAFPVEVDVFLWAYDGPAWELASFRHRSGWLMVAQARMVTSFAERSRTLVAAISDHGEVYAPHVAARLFDVPSSFPRDAECDPPEELKAAMEALYWDFLGAMDLENLRLLQDAEERTAERISAFEAECASFERKLTAAIRELRRERRRDDLTEARRAEIEARLKRLDDMPGELAMGMRQRIAEMRRETEELEAAVLTALEDHAEIEHCYTARWRSRSRRTRRDDIRLPETRELNFLIDPWLAGMDRPTLEQIAETRVFRNERDDE
jgi:hypothetical protein